MSFKLLSLLESTFAFLLFEFFLRDSYCNLLRSFDLWFNCHYIIIWIDGILPTIIKMEIFLLLFTQIVHKQELSDLKLLLTRIFYDVAWDFVYSGRI